MDTKQMEETAEDYTSSKLQQADILVAKPKFDLNGTDLLAFAEMGDGVKFCRIQCKGRSLINSRSSHVCIKKQYVTNGFIVFLYVIKDNDSDPLLYCFFSSSIEGWNINKNGEYVLNINKSFEDDFKPNKFDKSKVELIKQVISLADQTGEFKRLVHGSGGGVLSPFIGGGSGTVSAK